MPNQLLFGERPVSKLELLDPFSEQGFRERFLDGDFALWKEFSFQGPMLMEYSKQFYQMELLSNQPVFDKNRGYESTLSHFENKEFDFGVANLRVIAEFNCEHIKPGRSELKFFAAKAEQDLALDIRRDDLVVGWFDDDPMRHLALRHGWCISHQAIIKELQTQIDWFLGRGVNALDFDPRNLESEFLEQAVQSLGKQNAPASNQRVS